MFYVKRSFWQFHKIHRKTPVPENFVKFLTTPSLQNTSGRLLLKAVNYFRKKNLNHQKQSPRGVLLNFAKFTVKHLCQSLPFNKIAGLRPATLLKERLWHRCFLVNFAKFLITLLLTEHLQWLLLAFPDMVLRNSAK